MQINTRLCLKTTWFRPPNASSWLKVRNLVMFEGAEDIQGDPTQMAWMIWNTADPITTNTNRAWNVVWNENIFKDIVSEIKTYNELWADWILVICFGGFDHISSLGHVLGILLIGLSHLRSAGHLGWSLLMCASWLTSVVRLCYAAACWLWTCWYSEMDDTRSANTTQHAHTAAAHMNMFYLS